MEDYNVEDRLITNEDWENWLKSKEEYSNKRLSNMPETPTKKESKYAVIEWHPYPKERPPKEDVYLVTMVDKIPFVAESKYSPKKKKFTDEYYGDIFDDCIIAWSEKPEPYKEES